MVGNLEHQTRSERARVLLFRCLSWCLVGFGVLSTIAVVTGTAVGLAQDLWGTAKLWWLFLMLGSVSVLMIVIGLKGTKITSVSQLEEQDESFERRKEKLFSWLQNSTD